MKVKNVIFSGDQRYLRFWPGISEVVTKVLGMQPILFFINDHEDSEFYQDDFGLVKKIKNKTSIGSGFIGQIYRLYGTKFFQNEICLINDLDMMLFNKKWVNESLSSIHEDDLAILNGDAYDNNRQECKNQKVRFPMCYLVGKGKTFNKIVNTDRTFEEFAEEIYKFNSSWDSDEMFFSEKLTCDNHGVKYHPITRGYSSLYYCPGRIEKWMFESMQDRDCPGGSMYKLNLHGSINFDNFIDCHCWSSDAILFEKLKNEILERYV